MWRRPSTPPPLAGRQKAERRIETTHTTLTQNHPKHVNQIPFHTTELSTAEISITR